MSKTVKIEGQRFGRLIAISRSGSTNSKGSWLWNFKCDCGNVIEREAYSVTGGTTKSCGCYAREVCGEATRKHGWANTKEYSVWNKIRTRILDPEDLNYSNYGGRGLKIEEDFINDMTAFYDYLGPKPQDGNRYTVGRIDNDIGYVRGNLRWETYHTQAKNTRRRNTNTSGFTGVVWDRYQAVARWHDLNRRQRTKGFSVSKYGLLPAFAMACAHRELMLKQLISQGEPYSDKHGK